MSPAIHTAPRILLVDDDPVTIETLRRALLGLGTIYFASRGAEAVRLLSEVRPDIVLLDAELLDLTGYQILDALRSNPELADVPVLFVTRHGEQEIEQAVLERGAVDFITRPVRPAIVAMRVKTQLRLKEANDRLRELASIDPVTNLANRRAFDEMLAREWRRCLRNRKPVSLVMVDVDRFKRFNDHYGHAKGDQCLTAVAGALRGCVHRPFDLVARYDGEAFVMLLPETDTAGVLQVGQRILSTLAAIALPHAASDVSSHVTVSVGASSYDAACASWLGIQDETFAVVDPGVDSADLLAAANLALYAAKRRGRAQQCFRSIDAATAAELAAVA